MPLAWASEIPESQIAGMGASVRQDGKLYLIICRLLRGYRRLPLAEGSGFPRSQKRERGHPAYHDGMKKPEPVKSPFSELCQLHLDVERIAHQLRERTKKGWAPLRKHVDELYEIAMKLGILDKHPRTRF